MRKMAAGAALLGFMVSGLGATVACGQAKQGLAAPTEKRVIYPENVDAKTEIAPIVNKNFVVVHVNIGEYDKNLDLADKYDVPLKKGVPASAVLGSDGTLLYSQKQGEFESAKRISKEDVVAFLEKWKPGKN